MSLSIVILAAGKSKRMQTDLPKVLHKVGGKPLLQHVAETAASLSSHIYVIYGFGAEQIQSQLNNLPVQWVLQNKLLGTGHAVLQALPFIPDDHQVLVLVGDCPLVKTSTLRHLIDETATNEVGLVTANLINPTGYGRILHDQTGKVLGIVEDKDATPEQKRIQEINSGIILAPARSLKAWLPILRNDNAQGEFYLTDIIALANQHKMNVRAVLAQESYEVLGINDRIQLANLERRYQRILADQMMLSGVTLLDPNRFDLRGKMKVDKDVMIDVNCVFEGDVEIGSGTYIGSNCMIRNTIIGRNVEIKANSVIDDAVIGNNCIIGPFARIRPQTQLQENVHIGNFVEVKKSIIAKGSKVNHLSYIGDAEIGKNVNVGAGTITCNYDGVNKHKTVIEDDVFIGSDTQLVAPIVVKKGATLGAGTTLIKDAPQNQLTLSRAKQISIEGWQRPKKKPNEA